MKLISWNVNGLRALMSKGNLIPFIEAESPDIMAFQETKMQEDQFNFNFDGYFRYMNSAERKGYSGTMVLTKEKPLKVIYDIEEKEDPKEEKVDETKEAAVEVKEAEEPMIAEMDAAA